MKPNYLVQLSTQQTVRQLNRKSIAGQLYVDNETLAQQTGSWTTSTKLNELACTTESTVRTTDFRNSVT
jgi:hypothetical protein